MVDLCHWRAAIGRFYGVCVAKCLARRFENKGKCDRPNGDSECLNTDDVFIAWLCLLFFASFVISLKHILIHSVTLPFVFISLQSFDRATDSDNVAVTSVTYITCIRDLPTTLTGWVGLLLMRCGDVELNPGPTEGEKGDKIAAKVDTMRQTRLNTATAAAISKDRSLSNKNSLSSPLSSNSIVNHTATDFTLADLMLKLNSMDSGMNSKLDGVREDVSEIKERFRVLQEEVGVLRNEVNSLKEENAQLKDHRDALWTQMDKMQRKMEDLEGRSKRQNLIFYGMDKQNGETNESLETRVRELLTDSLEMAENVEFDRVHRINNKPNSPVIAKCTFYKDKVKILKLKNKLKGLNIFIGEDYSQYVRDTRKKLSELMKTMKNEGKNVKLVFDHLYVDGKKMFLAGDGMSVVER